MKQSARPRLATIPALALLVTLSVAPAAQAQDGFCALLTEEEVGQAFGDRVAAEPSFDGCSWVSDDGEGFFVFVSSYWDNLTMAERQAAVSDGQAVTVGGREAFYAPDYFALYIQLDQGLLVISGRAAEGDGLAPLQQLGEIAVGRAAQLPTPATPATPVPAPSFESDPELAALFPETLGGEPVTITTLTGEQLFLQSEDTETVRQIEELLVAHGLALSDVSIGFGSAGALAGSLTAVRFPGADASLFMDVMVSSIMGGGAAEQSAMQVAGKDVVKVTTEGGTQYLYPKDDVVWAVTAQEPALTEIFEALP